MINQNEKHYRKLIRQGATYMVSLPKDDLIELQWKHGDKILVEKIGKSIQLMRSGKPKIFSIGYSGRKIKDFIEILKENKIDYLVDVRNNAFSWNKEFSRNNIVENLAAHGIKYINLPKLGAPKDIRVEIKEYGNRNKFFELYSKWLQLNISYMNLIDVFARNNNTVLMCLEEDYRNCHRKVIGEKLEEDGYEVIQL